MDRNESRGFGWKRGLAVAAVGVALVSMVPLSAQAWNRGRGGPSPEQVVERMADELQLSDEQQVKVLEILTQRMEGRDEMRRAHQDERDAHRTETEALLAEVLSAEQMDELRQRWEDRQERRREHRRGAGRW